MISPARTDGNRRLYCLNDIDRLLEIKDLIDQGVNMAGIKQSIPSQRIATILNMRYNKQVIKTDNE